MATIGCSIESGAMNAVLYEAVDDAVLASQSTSLVGGVAPSLLTAVEAMKAVAARRAVAVDGVGVAYRSIDERDQFASVAEENNVDGVELISASAAFLGWLRRSADFASAQRVLLYYIGAAGVSVSLADSSREFLSTPKTATLDSMSPERIGSTVPLAWEVLDASGVTAEAVALFGDRSDSKDLVDILELGLGVPVVRVADSGQIAARGAALSASAPVTAATEQIAPKPAVIKPAAAKFAARKPAAAPKPAGATTVAPKPPVAANRAAAVPAAPKPPAAAAPMAPKPPVAAKPAAPASAVPLAAEVASTTGAIARPPAAKPSAIKPVAPEPGASKSDASKAGAPKPRPVLPTVRPRPTVAPAPVIRSLVSTVPVVDITVDRTASGSGVPRKKLVLAAALLAGILSGGVALATTLPGNAPANGGPNEVAAAESTGLDTSLAGATQKVDPTVPLPPPLTPEMTVPPVVIDPVTQQPVPAPQPVQQWTIDPTTGVARPTSEALVPIAASAIPPAAAVVPPSTVSPPEFAVPTYTPEPGKSDEQLQQEAWDRHWEHTAEWLQQEIVGN